MSTLNPLLFRCAFKRHTQHSALKQSLGRSLGLLLMLITASTPGKAAAQATPAAARPVTPEATPEIAQLDQLLEHHRAKGEWNQVGRLLTEKAQVLYRLGLPRQAIALLCDRPLDGQTTLDCGPRTALFLARQTGDRLGQAAALGSLGTIYTSQGKAEIGIELLEASLSLAQADGAVSLVVSALTNLGNANSSLATRSYRYAQLAEQDQDPVSQARLVAQGQAYDAEAITALQSSLAQTRDENQRQARLNLLLSQARQGRFSLENLASLTAQFEQQPDSLEKVYGLTQLARWYAFPEAMQQQSLLACNATPKAQLNQQSRPLTGAVQAQQLLEKAAAVGQRLGDRPLLATVHGELGHLYECQGRYKEALYWTRQAQLGVELDATGYRWDWQAGRLLEASGQAPEAIEAYESSIRSLEILRGDLAASDRGLQLDFRDTVALLYRQLAALQFAQVDRLALEQSNLSAVSGSPSQLRALVQSQAQSKSITPKKTPAASVLLHTALPQTASPSTALLQESLATLEKLHLSELQNYLGELCDVLGLDLAQSPEMSQTSAVIHTMILPDRLVAVARFADGQVQLKQVKIDQSALTEQVTTLRQQLERRSDLAHRYRPGAEQLYDWLVRPFEAELAAQGVEDLLFVHDGILRSIPMGALHDGQQFLVERYGLAHTPSLALLKAPTSSSSRPEKALTNSRILAFGLTEATTVEPRLAGPSSEVLLSLLRSGVTRQSFFASLPAVRQELTGLQSIAPQTQVFYNQDFTRDRLQSALNDPATSPTILHLATHARFGFDARETFLVTGETEPVTLNELYQMLQAANQAAPQNALLDLIVLTGCETAAGSDRDALGIAGVALHAGASSAVASLWQVDDAATAELVVSFYQQLNQGESKATALQLAQQTWLRDNPTGLYSHPGYWAALVMVGQPN